MIYAMGMRYNSLAEQGLELTLPLGDECFDGVDRGVLAKVDQVALLAVHEQLHDGCKFDN